jgi:hypothetical protein
MTPLSLVVLLTAGADPAPPLPPPGPFKWVPESCFKELRARAAALKVVDPAAPPGGGPSFLYRPAFAIDHTIRLPARPYQPQPGDIMLATDGSLFWTLMHNAAGTSHPTHSGVVFAMPDGRMAILEGGPHDTMRCRILEAIPHLACYEAEGRVWVRPRSVPLTPDQSRRLTGFALATDLREFAVGRLAVQLTPFRTRGPVRTCFVGKPKGLTRDGYFCSELVIEALVYAGLIDAATARPSATYPRDIFFGSSLNPYINRHLKLKEWHPPSRWTGTPVVDCRP